MNRTFVCKLNDRWRVTDDGLQWILERRERKASLKSSGYTGQSFCTQRRSLKRCIREKGAEPISDHARVVIDDLPDRYPYEFEMSIGRKGGKITASHS